MAYADPAFLFFPKDWLASESVSCMTLEQQGAYLRLLCFSWVHEGLPADLVGLARMLGVDPAYFREELWPPMEKCWEERDGRMVNTRLEGERQKRRDRSETMRQRGIAGNLSRWGSHKDRTCDPTSDGLRDGSATPQGSPSTSTSNCTSKGGVVEEVHVSPHPPPSQALSAVRTVQVRLDQDAETGPERQLASDFAEGLRKLDGRNR